MRYESTEYNDRWNNEYIQKITVTGEVICVILMGSTKDRLLFKDLFYPYFLLRSRFLTDKKINLNFTATGTELQVTIQK